MLRIVPALPLLTLTMPCTAETPWGDRGTTSRDSSSRSDPDLSLDSHLPGPRPLPRETETHSLHLLVRMFTEGMHGIVECLAQRRKQSRRSGKHSWVIWRHRRWPGVSVHREDRTTLFQQPCLLGAENEQMKGQDPWAPVLPLSR